MVDAITVTTLAYRTYGVMRGDVATIRWIALEPARPMVVLAAMLVATARTGTTAPLLWLAVCAATATLGVAAYSAAAWLVARAHDGLGSYIECARLSVYAMAPVALGVVSGTGLAIGVGVSFLVASGVMRVIHHVSWTTAAIISVMPTILLIAALSAAG